MTYPDEVMRAAREAAEAAGFMPYDVAGDEMALDAIARAIMAERERCKKVADKVFAESSLVLRKSAAMDIAAAISRGE